MKTPNSEHRTANIQHPTSSLWVFGCLGIWVLLLTGCSHFTTTQKDLNYEQGQPVREITTRAAAFTFWDSRSALANFKASQTDKTQGASVGALNQESSGTNTAATIKALVDLINATK